MATVSIKGIKLSASHGVLDSEKITPQEFLIDITYCYDSSDAAEKDDISLAVDYAEVCRTAYAICAENSFCLLEKLSREIALAICEKFPLITKAEVCIHKPHAPVGLPFGDICVTAQVEREEVILSLGSSLGDREKTLLGAIDRLNGVRGLSVKKVSDFFANPPYGGVAEREFVNCALSADCLISPRELLNVIHAIEADFLRTREKRWGDRTLDIDIVFFGNKIICEQGLCIPHPDYANRPFVIRPIKSIAPDFVCPLTHRRVSDM